MTARFKSLYDDNARYTDDAQELENRASQCLSSLFDDWLARGYSPRDISNVMTLLVLDLEMTSVLTLKPATPNKE